MATTSFKKDFRIDEQKVADKLVKDISSEDFGVEYEEVDKAKNEEKEEALLKLLASA